MSDNRAYVYQILPEGTSQDEEDSVHQTSPTWVLTVVRWLNRDTLRVTNVSTTEVLDPLIIVNDCLQVTVDSDKGTLTPSFSALLKITDVNYLTAIAPGDFVFVNMLNWEADADAVVKKVLNNGAINDFFDGFKGFFKVQGVRETLNVDAQTGTKTVVCRINGFAFTEFNNSIYYNPNVLNNEKDTQVLLFASNFGEVFNSLINHHGLIDVQSIIAVLIQTFIGSGPKGQGFDPVVVPSKNNHFFMPKLIGDLLNIKNVTAAKDIYNYIFGVQKYSGASVTDPGTGFNPAGLSDRFSGYFKYTPIPCQGNGLLKPEYWNQIKAWSILNQYTNSPVNEMYTCFRTDTDGDIMPTVVFRQIPFTTETFEKDTLITQTPVTKFMTLPRWYIPPSLITSLDIGRDESARINFVQGYGQSSFGKDGVSVSFETAAGNFLYDEEDVKRSGLRPYIFNSTFDEVSEGEKAIFFKSPIWAKIVGDSLIGGHLKLNGTITCMGITDPIAVGDNLEFNDVVYHIEQITHVCNIFGEDGRKSFRTTITLSSGVSVSSSDKGTRYAEMAYSNASAQRESDAKFNKLLPGISEAQHRYSRSDPDVAPTGNKSFPQPPSARITVNKAMVKNRKKNK